MGGRRAPGLSTQRGAFRGRALQPCLLLWATVPTAQRAGRLQAPLSWGTALQPCPWPDHPVPATAGVARSTGAPCVLLPGAGPAAGGGVTRRPCAHLSSWKLATPRWKKPTAMQASLVSAWSNAWGQRGPCNAKVCDPITPQPRQVASDGARAFHLPVVASLAALRACVQLRQQGGVTNPCVRHGDEKARPGQSALGVQMGRLWS